MVEGFGSRLLGIGKQLHQVKGQIEEVETKLTEKVENVGERVEEVKVVSDLNSSKLDGVDSKVTYVQRGVHLLCSVVAEGYRGNQGRLGDEVRDFQLQYEGEDVRGEADIEEVKSEGGGNIVRRTNVRRRRTPDRGGGDGGGGEREDHKTMESRLKSIRDIAEGLDVLLDEGGGQGGRN